MVTRYGNEWFSIALIFLISIGGVADLKAQRGAPSDGSLALALGPRVGIDWDDKIWSFGGQARIMLPFLPGLLVSPSADVFLVDAQNEWQANLDVALQLLPIIYGGAGIAVARDSLPTSAEPSIETGYNLFLGLTFPTLRLPVRPFAEVRWTEINRLVRPRRIIAGFDISLNGQPFRRR